MSEVFGEAGLKPEDVEELRHGTTVASNAILELKGAKVGLITSAGFRDILEILTLRMPVLYDLTWEKPPALVERYLRQVVDERISSNVVVERAQHTFLLTGIDYNVLIPPKYGREQLGNIHKLRNLFFGVGGRGVPLRRV